MSRSEIEAILNEVQRLSPEEQRLVSGRIADILAETMRVDNSHVTYSEMFGAGRGSFATPEEADAFLRRERDLWEN